MSQQQRAKAADVQDATTKMSATEDSARSIGIRAHWMVRGVLVEVDTIVTTPEEWCTMEEARSSDWSASSHAGLLIAQRCTA